MGLVDAVNKQVFSFVLPSIWEGGLASHGAAIGILLALWLYIRKYKLSFLWLIDRIVIVVALGGAFIAPTIAVVPGFAVSLRYSLPAGSFGPVFP